MGDMTTIISNCLENLSATQSQMSCMRGLSLQTNPIKWDQSCMVQFLETCNSGTVARYFCSCFPFFLAYLLQHFLSLLNSSFLLIPILPKQQQQGRIYLCSMQGGLFLLQNEFTPIFLETKFDQLKHSINLNFL